MDMCDVMQVVWVLDTTKAELAVTVLFDMYMYEMCNSLSRYT